MHLRPLFAVLLVALAGCTNNDPEPEQLNPVEITIDGVRINHYNPTALIEAHFAALNVSSAAAYEAMLEKPTAGRSETGFRFHIRDTDIGLLPWLTGTSWGYDVEVTIIRNMTNPDFAGGEPPVQYMHGNGAVLREETTPEGRRHTLVAALQVLQERADGWDLQTRFEFDLVPDEDGFWRIHKIAEFRSVPQPVEASWGQVKAAYH